MKDEFAESLRNYSSPKIKREELDKNYYLTQNVIFNKKSNNYKNRVPENQNNPKYNFTPQIDKKSDETSNLSPQQPYGISDLSEIDLEGLKEVINEEKKKNMKLRFENGEMNKLIEAFDKKELDYKKCIESLRVEKEIDSQYILKMEIMIANLEKQNDMTKCKSEENKQNLKSTLDEVAKFREFREQIFNISTLYDEINKDIIITLGDIKELLITLNTKLARKDQEKLDYLRIERIEDHFDKTVLNFEKSLISKQEEYNFLLQDKEKEIKILKEELKSLKEHNERLKDEIYVDKDMIIDLANRIRLKNLKLHQISKCFEENDLLAVSNFVSLKDNNKSEEPKSVRQQITRKNRNISDIQNYKTLDNFLDRINKNFNNLK